MELYDYINASQKDGDLIHMLQNQKISDEQKQLIDDSNTIKDKIIAVLKTVNDPEIPVNIWDLGLVYDIVVNDKDAIIKMTLTAPACPVAGAMPIEVEKRVKAYIKNLNSVKAELVWEPRWNKEMMSDEAKLILDMW